MKKITSLLFFAFLGLYVNSQVIQTASVEGITEYELKNGLKVLLFPDNSSQTITVNITYKVGSRHEGYGEKGMAHLLEHLVFKGTPNHPDIPKELSSHGARPNGTTWYDRTNYFETFNATDENLEWALDLEADRMVNSYIAKKDLESEFSVVRNEFESGENSPTGVLMSFQKNLEEKMKKLTVEDINRTIKKYFKTYDKWTVVNAGDFKNEIKKQTNQIDD
jgi:zinc protease